MDTKIGIVTPPLANKGPLKVLLVDDHEPTLSAITTILNNEYPRMEVVGATNDSEMASRLSREVAPDVIVLDLHLGADHGLDLMPVVRVGDTAVVVFSYSDSRAERELAMSLGAAAFVSKLSPVQVLVDAIFDAANGRPASEGHLS